MRARSAAVLCFRELLTIGVLITRPPPHLQAFSLARLGLTGEPVVAGMPIVPAASTWKESVILATLTLSPRALTMSRVAGSAIELVLDRKSRAGFWGWRNVVMTGSRCSAVSPCQVTAGSKLGA